MRFKYFIVFILIMAILTTLPACGYKAMPEQSPTPTSIRSAETTPVLSPVPLDENTPTLTEPISTLPAYPETPVEFLRVPGIMISIEDAEPIAPYTFCVKDGDIYIPDPLTNTIGIYRNGLLIETWSNTVGNGIAVMAFVGDTFYTISGSNIEQECGMLCRWDHGVIVDSSIATNRYDGGALNQVHAILDRNGEILLQYTAGDNFLVSDTGEMRRQTEYSFEMLKNGIDIISSDTGTVYSVSGENEPSGVFLIGHLNGFVYFEYAQSYFTEQGGWGIVRDVFQFAYDGTLINRFPMKEYCDYVPNTEICIHHHHVYQLYTENNQVIVLELSPITDEFSST